MAKVDELAKMIMDEPINEHSAVLAYEAGAVLQHAMYLKWAIEHGDDKDRLIALGKLKSELMDVLAQSWTLCIKVGLDPKEWLDMGCEKAIDAITKKSNGKLSEHMSEKW